MKSTRTLNLDELARLTPNISPIQCNYFAEACKIALENQAHASSINLLVKGDFDTSFQITWENITEKKGWKEPRTIAENGNIAIAFLLILELTEYQLIQQAVIGTGFDYWLGYKAKNEVFDEENFLNARLEVSGINKARQGIINRRVQQKIRQVGSTDYLNIPAYVVVTEFGTPISVITQK